jgi:hypothetical protein
VGEVTNQHSGKCGTEIHPSIHPFTQTTKVVQAVVSPSLCLVSGAYSYVLSVALTAEVWLETTKVVQAVVSPSLCLVSGAYRSICSSVGTSDSKESLVTISHLRCDEDFF